MQFHIAKYVVPSCTRRFYRKLSGCCTCKLFQIITLFWLLMSVVIIVSLGLCIIQAIWKNTNLYFILWTLITQYKLFTNVDIAADGLLVQGVQSQVLVVTGLGLPVPDLVGDRFELLQHKNILFKLPYIFFSKINIMP